VDADLRKPQIQELLSEREGPFLTDLLENPDTASKEAERLATPVENLSVATPRDQPEDPDVVLSSPKMERFIERLRASFDLIIFDTPPVLAVADATSLSSQCDATVVVAQAGKTEAEELGQATEELREAHAEVAGTVLNRFNPSEPSSYTSRYEYQDYGYYTDGDRKAST
jgi:capsular exopolysaccharide synthesis family protein